jgi:hypothetical protein
LQDRVYGNGNRGRRYRKFRTEYNEPALVEEVLGNMASLGEEHEGRTVSVGQVAIASLVGSTIQWYGFFLYGTAAATVFNVLFFPSLDPFLGTLSSFATFAVGFVA